MFLNFIIVQGLLSWCRPLFFSLFFLSQLYALAASSFFSLSFPFFFFGCTRIFILGRYTVYARGIMSAILERER